MVDTKGLITTTRGDTLPEHKQSVARTDGTPDLAVCVYQESNTPDNTNSACWT